MLAIKSFPTPFQAAARTLDDRLGRYALLRRLPAGLRAEVWLGLPPGCHSLSQLVAIKVFFPHVPGPALTALADELALAPQLVHPNIVQTLRVGRDGESPFLVSEHLEGTTLRALLRRANAARASVAPAAVARVLLGIARAVSHAQGQATSPGTKALVERALSADDVFVTFDGAVKLLGFKAPLASTAPNGSEPEARAPAARQGSSAHAAIDALLSEHLTPELGQVLAAGSRPGRRGPYGLPRVARALERWQAGVLGSDGRAELAALTEAMFPSARLDHRAQLEVRLEQWLRARSPLAAEPDDSAPPASGVRALS